MKVVVSVKPQTQSSRGLVHYIAHSKIDTARESSGRELFNDRTDSMNVQEANLLLKVGVSSHRPQNSDLLHLIVSVRPEDYRNLGTDEKERIGSLKAISREAMLGLGKITGIEPLDWAAAVHLNTDNPHVHIAISKQYISPQLDAYQRLNRIPKDALPHYELIDGKKTLIHGAMIDAAAKKMDSIIERNLAKEQTRLEPVKQQIVEQVERPQQSSKPQPPEHARTQRSYVQEIHIR